MNQLHSRLKKATNVKDAWQITVKYLCRISSASNRHMIWTIDSTGGRTAMHGYGNSLWPKTNPDKASPRTHYMWLFTDPKHANPNDLEILSQTQPRENRHMKAIGACLLYAHAHIMTLKKNESALKAGITPRECETLLLLARGLRSDKIAYRMGIKRVTVNLHISNARRKLDSTTRTQAVARAVYMGIITP